jgi:asparagine synthase (glutamine-hydrolysing)
MCGIAGIVGARDTAVMRRMMHVMVHRGPDDQGLQAFEGVPGFGEAVLGFQRLSIIDLSPAGHQPMGNEDGTRWIVFNGEIYNYRELRVELESAGHRFTSRTDTEVVLHAHEEWGPRCVDRFVGMFAYAILDVRHGELVLVRDRLGVKPLYYTEAGGGLAFASEVKSLLELPAVSCDVDPLGLDLYLALGYVPGPRSLFAGVRKLPPGHMLRWTAGGRREISAYWSLPGPTPTDEPVEEQARTIRRLLEESVRLRMVADVPVGCLLSGGLDSSIATAMMARLLTAGQRLDTFCVGYESGDSRHHEHPFAALVASDLGTRHHEIICTNEFAIETLPRLVWHMDEPTGDDLMAPYARVCELARRDVKVVLSGEGADEFMYGYRYYALEGVRRRARLVPGPARWAARELIAGWMDPESFKARALRCCLSDTPMDSFLEWSGQLTVSERERLVGPRARLGGIDRRASVREALAPPPGNGVHFAAGMDGRYRMVDFILNRTDKLSMAASLECREPFLDHRLIEYLARVPVSRQIEGFACKQLLRRSVEGLLPRQIAGRRKKPFGAPVEEWLGPLRRRYLDRSHLVEHGFLEGEPLRRLVSRSLSGGVLSSKIWTLVALEVWFRVFMERDRSAREAATAGALP